MKYFQNGKKGMSRAIVIICAAAFLGLAIEGCHFLYTGNIVSVVLKRENLSNSLSDFYFARGNYYFNGGTYDLSQASQNYWKSMEFVDGARKGRAYYQLARISFLTKDLEEARSRIEKSMELNPALNQNHYTLGLIYGFMGELKKGQEQFEIFIKNRENKHSDWAGYNDLAWLYFRENRFEDVVSIANEGLSFFPNNPWLANSLGVGLLNLKRYSEATENLLIAKSGFDAMSPEDWGRAYPGNNPDQYPHALAVTRRDVAHNLHLAQDMLARKDQ